MFEMSTGSRKSTDGGRGWSWPDVARASRRGGRIKESNKMTHSKTIKRRAHKLEKIPQRRKFDKMPKQQHNKAPVRTTKIVEFKQTPCQRRRSRTRPLVWINLDPLGEESLRCLSVLFCLFFSLFDHLPSTFGLPSVASILLS